MQDQQHNAPAVLATMKQDRDGAPPNQHGQTWHVYDFEGGGYVFTQTPIEEEDLTAPVVDAASIQPQPPQEQPRSHLAQQPRVLFYTSRILALILFMLFLDSVAPLLPRLFIPTVTVTILPQVHTVTLKSSVQLGRLTDPITISQSQTAPATGKGHQDAEQATGTLTFYNGSYAAKIFPAGTTYTGSDGVSIALNQTVTIPAAVPPQFGEVTTPAYTLSLGQQGNIAAGDINIALSSDLTVKNLSPFTGGLDERDFSIVTQHDLVTAGAGLQARVSRSMDAALNGQKAAGEEIIQEPCSPTTTADHQINDEASNVTVTVSLTCQAIVYSTDQLQTTATEELTAKVQQHYGHGYIPITPPQVQVTKATVQVHTVTLSFLSSGTYVFDITKAKEQSLKTLIVGKPRLTALHLLTHLPGIRQVSISGIQDNAALPDMQHITMLIIILASQEP